MKVKITVSASELKRLARPALTALQVEKGDRLAKVLQEHKKAKEEYDTLSWWKKLFQKDPGTHPLDGEERSLFSHWKNQWWRASDFNKETIKLCKEILELSKVEAPVLIGLRDYNVIKSWAQGSQNLTQTDYVAMANEDFD